jgi:hypothetical protein
MRLSGRPSLPALFVIVSFLAIASPGRAQKRAASPLRIGGEVAAGTVAIPVGLISGLFVGSGFRREVGSTPSLIGGAAGAVLGPPLAVMAAGTGGPSSGRFLPTLAGAAAGYLATGAVIVVSRRGKARLPSFITAASFLLPAIGATIAYNRSRP